MLIGKCSQGNVKTWHISIYAATIHAEKSLSPSQRQRGKGNYLWCRVWNTVPQLWTKIHRWKGQKIQTRLSKHQKYTKNVPESRGIYQVRAKVIWNWTKVQWQIISIRLSKSSVRRVQKWLTGRIIRDSDKSKNLSGSVSILTSWIGTGEWVCVCGGGGGHTTWSTPAGFY